MHATLHAIVSIQSVERDKEQDGRAGVGIHTILDILLVWIPTCGI